MDVNSQEWLKAAHKEHTDNQVVLSDNPQVVRIKPGEEGRTLMPYSEVCMHLKVAGKMMRFRLIANSRNPDWAPSVQLLNADGTEYSFPIGQGEGGVYNDYDAWNEGEGREYKYYYYKA